MIKCASFSSLFFFGRNPTLLFVCFRDDFKVLLMACKAVNGQASVYLSDLLQPFVPTRSGVGNSNIDQWGNPGPRGSLSCMFYFFRLFSH